MHRIRKYRYLWLILVPVILVALYFGRSQLPQEMLPSVLQADPDPVCIELLELLEGGVGTSVPVLEFLEGLPTTSTARGVPGDSVRYVTGVHDGDSEAVELCLNESSGER